MAHSQLHTGLLNRLEHSLAVLQRAGQRLLAEDVLARSRGQLHVQTVYRCGRRNKHRVNIGALRQFLGIRHDLGPQIGCEFLRSFQVSVRDSYHPASGLTVDDTCVVAPHIPSADDTYISQQLLPSRLSAYGP